MSFVVNIVLKGKNGLFLIRGLKNGLLSRPGKENGGAEGGPEPVSRARAARPARAGGGWKPAGGGRNQTAAGLTNREASFSEPENRPAESDRRFRP